MINPRENMIVIEGQIKTWQIASCSVNNRGDRYNIVFTSNPTKTYSYAQHKVIWLTTPILFDPAHCHLHHEGYQLRPLSYIAAFQKGTQKFWYVEYHNGVRQSFHGTEINIVKSCLDNKQAKSVFEYLSRVAAISTIKSEDDDMPLLLKQYQNIDFIADDCAAAPYLNPEKFRSKTFAVQSLIYPFGCNASQQKAVEAAFQNQISVIQGPPGTGKTQTILNIIANIISQGKSVMVVSNNNSAIANVVEKMERYDMGFVTATLGSRTNKETFIASQETNKSIPAGIDQWHSKKADNLKFLNEIEKRAAALSEIFAKQERLALARQELDAAKVEQTHFEQEVNYDHNISIRKQMSSIQLMNLWNELERLAEGQRYSGIFAKVVNVIRDYLKNRRLHKIFNGIADKPSVEDIVTLIPIIQHQFYITKTKELNDEIVSLEKSLSMCDAERTMRHLQEDSMMYLRNVLYHKYGKNHKRQLFALHSFGKELTDEYPVILSTTFSSRTNFRNETILDYVIMDEASQISAETGALALMCARNAVIVGDSKQLPNVITEEDKTKLLSIAMDYNVDERYDCAKNNFLQSICQVLPLVPQTLLREHYRCHPKIINFCNQKFYGGKLLIMTKDNGEEEVICAKRTVVGDHSRGTMNQREIDVISKEVLPNLFYPAEETGIITPYNNQVNALRRMVDASIDVATVHKFQGREKDVIIMSTVDDIVTSFSDDPNLLNVAISRAKKRFCLVVSGNEQPKECNISDLLAYIVYNECTVTESSIHSILTIYMPNTQKQEWHI